MVKFQGWQGCSAPEIEDTWGTDFPTTEYVSTVTGRGDYYSSMVENTVYANSSWKEMHALKILHELMNFTPDSLWCMKVDDDA